MKRTLFPALVFITLLAAVPWCTAAVGAAEDPTSKRETHLKKTSPVKMQIRLAAKTLTATLVDSPTTADFISLLPLMLTLKDSAATEKISDLPRKLTTKGAPAGSDPDVGDIAYYAPWGNLAIYHKDFGYSEGLIKLGRIDGDVEALRTAGPLKATIELVK